MSGNARIQIRRDTAANWTAANPVLANGEFGFETDTRKLKIGDGSSAWASLGYHVEVHVGTSPPANTNAVWIDTN
jgi:hypothetical protein